MKLGPIKIIKAAWAYRKGKKRAQRAQKENDMGKILVPVQNDPVKSASKANGAAVQGGISVATVAGLLAMLQQLGILHLSPEQQLGVAAVAVPVVGWAVKFIRDMTKKRTKAEVTAEVEVPE